MFDSSLSFVLYHYDDNYLTPSISGLGML